MSAWFKRVLVYGGVFVAGIVVGAVVMVGLFRIFGFWTLALKAEKAVSDVAGFFSGSDGDPA